MNKKGLFGMNSGGGMPGRGKKTLSGILGLILLLFGLIPLLNSVGGMSIPFIGISATVQYVIMVLGGLFLIIDSMSKMY